MAARSLFDYGMLATVLLFSSTICATAQPHTSTPASLMQSHSQQSPLFIENRGQWDSRARFLFRSPDLDLWITGNGMVYDIHRIVPGPDIDERSFIHGDACKDKPTVHRTAVSMTFLVTEPTARAHGSHRAQGYHNYFIGNDRSKWAMNVPLYSAAGIEQLYDGIDAIFYLDAGQPRYDLVVAPGADPSLVQMKFEGADGIDFDERGSLVIQTSLGEIRQRELFAYQMRDNKREQVQCAFVRDKDGTVRFDVGNYDRSRPLVIDPAIIVFSTYLGGTANEGGGGIAVDDLGNTYISGSTLSTDFPTPDAKPSRSGAFVMKLNSSGALLYTTILSGEFGASVRSVAVDDFGNSYITGYTQSSNFPTMNASQPKYGGNIDVFVTRLTDSGALSFSTFLGNNGREEGSDIAVDASGNMYVAGETYSATFPTLNPAQSSNAGEVDAIIIKFTKSGERSFSTYLGGSGSDRAYGIALDINGDFYVAGATSSTDFPTLHPVQPNYGGGPLDPFVTKLTNDGSFVFSTFLGGSKNDFAKRVAVDESGNVYIVGGTSSSDFPTLNPMQSSYADSNDGFIVKMTSTGERSFSTFLGGISEEFCQGIAVDRGGNVFVAGRTSSNNFPVLDALQTNNAGSWDAYVTRLTASGMLSYSTFFGGSKVDEGGGIAVDGNGDVYLLGSTSSTDLPTLNSLQSNFAGRSDLFVTKFSFGSSTVPSQDIVSATYVTNAHLRSLAPNPVSTEFQITYTLSEPSAISVEVFSIDGRWIATPLINQVHEAGSHFRSIDVRTLSPGVYMLRLVSNEGWSEQRFVIMR